ncbi:hypothetical protein [Saliniramus sp.]|uniref:hypothetical protein n=1 Tax=Saliniramus sp. TaxID=2986772 RepID=UPI002CE3FABC|nr:hypothetical protein [Saliniramus sp.]HMB11347.1 hypothetical protein [Saliniramus sp.]
MDVGAGGGVGSRSGRGAFPATCAVLPCVVSPRDLSATLPVGCASAPGLRVAVAARAVLADVRADGRADDFSADADFAGFVADFVAGFVADFVAGLAALLAVFADPLPDFATEAGGEDFAAFAGGAAPLAGS